MCDLINTHTHKQGPVSVQAHRTEGVTGSERQEEANGVKGGIGVRGGNRDRKGVRGGEQERER